MIIITEEILAYCCANCYRPHFLLQISLAHNDMEYICIGMETSKGVFIFKLYLDRAVAEDGAPRQGQEERNLTATFTPQLVSHLIKSANEFR